MGRRPVAVGCTSSNDVEILRVLRSAKSPMSAYAILGAARKHADHSADDNPNATLHYTERCSVALDKVLGKDAFNLDRILEL